jgi:hypothetical protein
MSRTEGTVNEHRSDNEASAQNIEFPAKQKPAPTIAVLAFAERVK